LQGIPLPAGRILYSEAANNSHTRSAKLRIYWGFERVLLRGEVRGQVLKGISKPNVKSEWHLARIESLSTEETSGEFGALLADGM
jgi:hypothetical protein